MTKRDKILELISTLVRPFDEIIRDYQVDGMEGLDDDLIPEPIRNVRDFTKEKLAEARPLYEDLVVGAVDPHLDEADIDAILAFNKSPAGVKLRGLNNLIQENLNEAIGKWYQITLEPHVEEVKRIAGVTEPGPAEESKPATELEIPEEPLPPMDPPPKAA